MTDLVKDSGMIKDVKEELKFETKEQKDYKIFKEGSFLI